MLPHVGLLPSPIWCDMDPQKVQSTFFEPSDDELEVPPGKWRCPHCRSEDLENIHYGLDAKLRFVVASRCRHCRRRDIEVERVTIDRG